MSKIAWIDTETTGLNPKEHALIQLSGIIEIDGCVKESNHQPAGVFDSHRDATCRMMSIFSKN